MKKTAQKSQKPGPKVGNEGPAVVVAVSIPEKVAESLDKWRAKAGLSKSAAVAEAIRRLVG